MGIVIGIDPGVSGAVAFVFRDRITIADMPTIEIRGKRRVCAHGLRSALLGRITDDAVAAVV
ncbi:MAG: crossover junction endodeoxyribonuclease, partial [Proteobacteria bacterium]|nr:crossover junction endodeoxyribonuclease [Pseudomonadota bacterium]